jgi:hypothetical protein
MKASTTCSSTEMKNIKIVIYKYHWPANKRWTISASKHNIHVRGCNARCTAAAFAAAHCAIFYHT